MIRCRVRSWAPSIHKDEYPYLLSEIAAYREVVRESRQPHFWWQILRLHWRCETAVRCQLRCACGSFGHSVSCTCWLLDVSRLIASRMVFRAQGESPQRLPHDKREQRGSGESCNAYSCTEARKFA